MQVRYLINFLYIEGLRPLLAAKAPPPARRGIAVRIYDGGDENSFAIKLSDDK